MALKSKLFQGNKKLESASVNHSDHIVKGAKGDHVRKIQIALQRIDDLAIDAAETASALYGPSTAKVVVAYKEKRDIINRSYQNQVDNIVGIMTMKSLDEELVELEKSTKITVQNSSCPINERSRRGFVVS